MLFRSSFGTPSSVSRPEGRPDVAWSAVISRIFIAALGINHLEFICWTERKLMSISTDNTSSLYELSQSWHCGFAFACPIVAGRTVDVSCLRRVSRFAIAPFRKPRSKGCLRLRSPRLAHALRWSLSRWEPHLAASGERAAERCGGLPRHEAC